MRTVRNAFAGMALVVAALVGRPVPWGPAEAVKGVSAGPSDPW